MGLALIECPPPASMNHRPGAHWTARHRRKRQAEGELAMLLLAAGVPRPIPGGRVHATAQILFPTVRRRDEGNYRTALEKALGDALAPHDPEHPFRWLPDDTPEHFTFGAVTFGQTNLNPARVTHGRAVPAHRRPAVCNLTLAWGEALLELKRVEADALERELYGARAVPTFPATAEATMP